MPIELSACLHCSASAEPMYKPGTTRQGGSMHVPTESSAARMSCRTSAAAMGAHLKPKEAPAAERTMVAMRAAEMRANYVGLESRRDACNGF
jgi:hypothetical protein